MIDKNSRMIPVGKDKLKDILRAIGIGELKIVETKQIGDFLWFRTEKVNEKEAEIWKQNVIYVEKM